jgi:hypothetical protein
MSFGNWVAGLEWLVDGFVQYLYRTVEGNKLLSVSIAVGL